MSNQLPVHLRMSAIAFTVVALLTTGGAFAQSRQFLDALSGNASPSDLHDAGDVNADGVLDYIVGFPQDNGGIGMARVLDGVDASVLFDVWGVAPGDLLGSDIRGAGDVNGDGYGDVVVGAPGDGQSGTPGYVHIVSGLDASVLLTLEGPSSGSGFGAAVTGAGDLDGDGLADILVGAPLDDFAGVDAGSVFGFSGVTGDVIFGMHGDAAGDNLGSDVDAPCNAAANGNGGSGWGHDMDEDIIIGATQEDSGDTGYALIISREDFTIRFRVEGDAAWDNLGAVVGLAGDVNDDGVGDVIVAANPVDASGQSTNVAYSRIYSGADGSILETVTR